MIAAPATLEEFFENLANDPAAAVTDDLATKNVFMLGAQATLLLISARARVDDPASIVDAMRFANSELGVFFKQLRSLGAADETKAN